MAGNAIAKGNVLVSLNADQFATGMQHTKSKLSSWVGGAGEVTGSGFLKSFGKVLKMGGPVALAGLAVEGTMAVAGAVKDFGMGLVSEVEDIGKMGTIAKAMGMTPEAFTGIAGVAKSAGEDTREFIESLVTMGKLGQDAASGVGEVAGPAFEKLGLSAKEFVKLSPDKQFYQMFEALQKVGPGLDQTRLLMNAFGEDGGKYLLPLLAKTPDELRKMGAQFALTGEQVKKASEAQQAISSLKNSFDMGWKRLAVAAAPVLKFIANSILGLIDFVTPVFNYMERWWNKITEMSGIFWDGITAAGKEAWTWIQQTFSGLFDWVGDLPTVEQTVVAVFRGIGVAAAWAWDVIKIGAGVVAIAAGAMITGFAAMTEGFNQVIQLGKSLPEELRPAGFNKFADSVAGFSKDTLDKGTQLTKWGTTAINNFGKSGDEFNSWLDRALIKSKEVNGELKAATEAPATSAPLKLSVAVMKGSMDAYSMVVKNQYRDLMGGEKDTQKKIEKNTGKAAKDGSKTKDNTGNILKFVEGLGKV